MMTNYLSPLEFRVSIKRLPNTQFFTQQTSIPNISTNPIQQPTRFNPIFTTGDNITFSNLDMTFIVDEQMNNYIEIFDWIVSSSYPDNHGQYKAIKDSEDGVFSDISVMIMNSKKNPNIEISYKNCFPIALSDVALNTTDQDVTYPQATATFQYDSFSIKRLT